MSQDQAQVQEKLEIFVPNGRLGTNVIEAKGVSKAFREKLLYDDLNFVYQAGIVGIIGPNGAGKRPFSNDYEQEHQTVELSVGETVKLAMSTNLM